MKRRLSTSVIVFLALASAALAASAYFFLTKPDRSAGRDLAATRLKEQRNLLSQFSDEAIAALEVRQKEALAKLPTQGEISSFLSEIGTDWTVQSMGR